MTRTFPKSGVTILGGHQTDFAENIASREMDVADLTRDAINATLEDAGIDAAEVESIHVGNAFGQLYNGQGHMGAMPATVIPALWGVPSMRHEAGVKLAMGTDSGVTPHGQNLDELKEMYSLGMPAADVFVASTKAGSELMGIEDTTGTIEAGKVADLVVFEGTELDVANLRERVVRVIQDGITVAETAVEKAP